VSVIYIVRTLRFATATMNTKLAYDMEQRTQDKPYCKHAYFRQCDLFSKPITYMHTPGSVICLVSLLQTGILQAV